MVSADAPDADGRGAKSCGCVLEPIGIVDGATRSQHDDTVLRLGFLGIRHHRRQRWVRQSGFDLDSSS